MTSASSSAMEGLGRVTSRKHKQTISSVSVYTQHQLYPWWICCLPCRTTSQSLYKEDILSKALGVQVIKRDHMLCIFLLWWTCNLIIHLGATFIVYPLNLAFSICSIPSPPLWPKVPRHLLYWWPVFHQGHLRRAHCVLGGYWNYY